ncbi:MAG: apolipoprotein N-acyltransferase [Chthoniobacterales bacterium]|nr:apolipoprotein N-acyltransferase [Chthoniobacterales bacterium]
MRKALRCWPWLAAITTGLLCTGCCAPFDFWWLGWIALTPLLAAVWFSGQNSKRRWLRDLVLGYVAGATFFWTVFSWLTTVTTSGWILVGAYMGVYFALWTWFCGRLRPAMRAPIAPARAATRWSADAGNSPEARSPWLRSTNNLGLAFLLASVWVTQESLRGIVFSGWGWNTLGTTLHAQWPLIQIADITGVPGLSFLVAFANVIAITTARRFVLESQTGVTRPHYDFTFTLLLIVAAASYGIRAVRIPAEGESIRVAAVQSNIPREQKFSREFAQRIFDQFTRLSEYALHAQDRPDLLIWPESSMPGPVLQDEDSYRFVMDFSAAAKTDLLLGAIDQDGARVYNAALLVSEAGKRVQLYRKIHLVPFGEYIPGRHTIPFLAQVVGDQVPDDFAVGTEFTLFHLTNDKVQVAPLICFEDTIGDLTRQFVRGGANLLVNVTNDGWFLRSAGSKQHLANAVFRCVETRRPMVRAANTGVTCFVNEWGRLTQVLLDDAGNQFTEGVLSGVIRVPTGGKLTFYVRHGEIFAHACAAITAIMFVVIVVKTVRRRPLAPNRASTNA